MKKRICIVVCFIMCAMFCVMAGCSQEEEPKKKTEQKKVEVQTYEPKEIEEKDFLSSYATQVHLSEEEAAVKLESEHSFLKYYRSDFDNYDIVYEERKMDKELGDGFILTSTIYTEMLVDKETKEYVAYGVAVPIDIEMRGSKGEIVSFGAASGAWTKENGTVIVSVNGQASIVTDGGIEFSNENIKETVENNYTYMLTGEDIVFTL